MTTQHLPDAKSLMSSPMGLGTAKAKDALVRAARGHETRAKQGLPKRADKLLKKFSWE